MNVETEKKSDIIKAARELKEAGILDHTGGSISVRVDSDSFYYAGGEIIGGDPGTEDIRRVRIKRPEGEVSVHACVYRAREDVGSVIFTKQTLASVLGVLKRETFAAENSDGEMVKIRVTPFSMPGSDAQRSHLRRLVGKSGETRFLIAANSGVWLLGGSCEEAVSGAYALEQFADSWLKEFCNTDIHPGVVHGYGSEWMEDGIGYSRSDTPGRVKSIHEELYNSRPDIGAVVHDVSDSAKTVSRLGGLNALYFDDQVFLSVNENTKFVYDDGIYCVGRGITQAERVAEAAERACVAQLAALRSGEAHVISRRDERRLKRR